MGADLSGRRSRCARATGPAQRRLLESEAGEHIDRPIIRFRLACCHAQAGAGDVALEELRRAIELDPSMRERAATEEQLAPLRGLEGWRALVG